MCTRNDAPSCVMPSLYYKQVSMSPVLSLLLLATHMAPVTRCARQLFGGVREVFGTFRDAVCIGTCSTICWRRTSIAGEICQFSAYRSVLASKANPCLRGVSPFSLPKKPVLEECHLVGLNCTTSSLGVKLPKRVTSSKVGCLW